MSERLLRAAIIAQLDGAYLQGASLDDLEADFRGDYSASSLERAVRVLLRERVLGARLHRERGVVYRLLPPGQWCV